MATKPEKALFLVATFVAPYLAASARGSQVSSQSQGPLHQVPTVVCIRVMSLQPIAGLEALIQTDCEDRSKLSNEELRKRYDRLMSQVKSAKPPGDPVAEEKLYSLKTKLASTFEILERRGLASPRDADELFFIVVERPSVVSGGYTNLAYVRSLPRTIERIVKTPIGKEERRRPATVVADAKGGLALGFLEAEPIEGTSEVEPGQTLVVKRRFIRAIDEPLPNEERIYEVGIEVQPSSFENLNLKPPQ